MRAILTAAAALAVLSTPAQAQADRLEFPGRPDMQILACVTPFHYDEGLALVNAGQSAKVDPNTCGFLDGGTRVTVVDTIGDYYARVLVELNGRMVRLFVNNIMLADRMEERRVYGLKAKQAQDQAYVRDQAIAAERMRVLEEIDDTEQKRDRCNAVFGWQHPACTYLSDKVRELAAGR